MHVAIYTSDVSNLRTIKPLDYKHAISDSGKAEKTNRNMSIQC